MMKNTYNILLKAAAVIAVAAGLTSCLEKFPGDAIPESEGMKTFNDAEQTLTGIYSSLMSGALYSGYLTLLPDIQTDLVHAVQGNTNTYGTLWQWDIRPTNAEIEAVYGALYRVIGQCNFYLDQVDALRADLTDDETITYLDFYTGEVYCARALAYLSFSSASARLIPSRQQMSRRAVSQSTAHTSARSRSPVLPSGSLTDLLSVTLKRQRNSSRMQATDILLRI